jgi:hypothetical protein
MPIVMTVLVVIATNRADNPFEYSPFSPAEPACAVWAQKTQMTAVFDNVHFPPIAAGQALERFNSYKGIVAGREKKGRHANLT